MTLDCKIRKYELRDREAIRQICADTGFLGKPIDSIFCDRNLFADLITTYYLDKEPEHTLVAEDQDKVVGYLMGSTNPHYELSSSLMIAKHVAIMVGRMLRGKYACHPRSRAFVSNLLTKAPFEIPGHPSSAAHLHLNVREGYRSGLGLHLLIEYEKMLGQEGVEQYYGQLFSSEHHHPERLFDRFGFKIFDRKETTLFKPEVSETMHLITIYKKII